MLFTVWLRLSHKLGDSQVPIRICPEGFENPWPSFQFNIQVLGCRTSHNSDSRKAGAHGFQPNLIKNVADPRILAGSI